MDMNQKRVRALALRLRQTMPARDRNSPAYAQWVRTLAAVRDVAVPAGHVDMFDELSGYFGRDTRPPAAPAKAEASAVLIPPPAAWPTPAGAIVTLTLPWLDALDIAAGRLRAPILDCLIVAVIEAPPILVDEAEA